jgi:hypothetical protein
MLSFDTVRGSFLQLRQGRKFAGPLVLALACPIGSVIACDGSDGGEPAQALFVVPDSLDALDGERFYDHP